MYGPSNKSVVALWTVIAGAVALTVTLAVAGVKPGDKPLPGDSKAGAPDRAVPRATSPRKPLPNPIRANAPRIKPGDLIERVVVDDLTPEQLQEVMVTVELKKGIDPSKAVILIAGRRGNPRIVRFYAPGPDHVRVVVLAGGRHDSREVGVKVGKATQLRTAALLDAKPYAFRPNTVEFRVVGARRASNMRFTWAFGDGQSATTDVPWTTHTYPASALLKTYQASVSFNPEAGGGGEGGTVVPGGGTGTPRVRPPGTARDVTLRETVVRWPRPAGEKLARIGEAIEDAIGATRERTGPLGVTLGRDRPQPKRKQTKLRDYAVGYEVYQAMKVLRKQVVTIEDLYRLKQEGKIKPWVPRARTRTGAGESVGEAVLASYAGPQLAQAGGDEDLDRLAEELYGPGYEFVYIPGRLVNARKGDLWLIKGKVPGVVELMEAMGQDHTHMGIMAEDQYTVRDMSADVMAAEPRKAGEVFRGSETDFSDPVEEIPYRLNPIHLRQLPPGIREQSVDEAIVAGEIPLDTTLLVKPLPAHEAEDRPRVEAVVEAARRIESSVGLPGVYTNFYKLYAFTDVRQMGMCSGYVWTACGDSGLNMPLFDYSPELRGKLAQVVYDAMEGYLFRKAVEKAYDRAGDTGVTIASLAELVSASMTRFARNGANQVVNTFAWDDPYNLSHDWANYSDEQIGWSHTVSPDNMRPRWYCAEEGVKTYVDGWGRPWGHEEPLEYELGSYRAVRRDGGEPAGPRGATTAGRVKLVLHKLKCDETEETTDEVYVRITWKNREGRTIQTFFTKVYKNLDHGDKDDPEDGDEAVFTDADRENVGWVDIGDGLTITATLYEQDNGRGDLFDPDDKLGTKDITLTADRPIPIPAGSTLVFGEPPGRRQDDPATWKFGYTDVNPLVSDYKYRIWYQTIYAPAR